MPVSMIKSVRRNVKQDVQVLSTKLLFFSDVFPPPPLLAMTSNTTPSPFVISASSVFHEAPYSSWKAFDGNIIAEQSWYSSDGSMPQWLAVDYGQIVTSARYVLTNRLDAASGTPRSPRNFRMQVSVDNTNWEDADVRISQSFVSGESKSYTFPTRNSRYWRIFVESVNSSGDFIHIGELQFFRD